MILKCADADVVTISLRQEDDNKISVLAYGPHNVKSCIAIITFAGIVLPENIAPEHGFALDFAGAVAVDNE